MARVLVRYWAAARAAAGVAEESHDADTAADLLAAVAAGHDAAFATVLARSSLLIDGQALGQRSPAGVLLADGSLIEVLPPFAGG